MSCTGDSPSRWYHVSAHPEGPSPCLSLPPAAGSSGPRPPRPSSPPGTSTSAGPAEAKGPTSKNDTPGIALVGCGGMGRGDAKNAERFGRIVALCDVDENQLAAAGKTWPKAATLHDFRKVMDRKDVDVVICGTVDHWHTLVSLAAMRAGKDVYCEKPLTLTIDEGKRLVEAQAKTKRVLQTGSQQRSDKNFRLAC